MADLERLYQNRGTEKAMEILAKATKLAKDSPDIHKLDLQRELDIGYSESVIVLDWLADTHEIEMGISEHLIRQGRKYAHNHPFPSLSDMTEKLGVGETRAQLVMQALQKRGIIRIKPDFAFERTGRMTSFAGFIRQLKVIGKKYDGRCEPWLLKRLMFVDPLTAMRLAQYGEEFLGFTWKERSRELM